LTKIILNFQTIKFDKIFIEDWIIVWFFK